MNSKKTISSFINPNWVLMIILMLIPIVNFFALIVLLCNSLPAAMRAKKCLSALESRGELDAAASELASSNSRKYINDKVVLTDNYMFCKGTGVVLSYSDILWAYRHRNTTSFLFIPIKVQDSLCVAAKGMKPRMVATMGKDKTEQIKNAIVDIYNHNNNCIIGYNNEAIAKYKELSK